MFNHRRFRRWISARAGARIRQPRPCAGADRAAKATELNVLADAIAAKGHIRPRVIVADLGDAKGPCTARRKRCKRRAIEPSIVVNNAGFGLLATPLCSMAANNLRLSTSITTWALTDLTLQFHR